MKKKANNTIKNKKDITTIQEALKKEGMEELKKAFVEVKAASFNVFELKSILLAAAKSSVGEDRLEKIKFIIESSPKKNLLDSKDELENTVLTEAVKDNDFELVKYLLDKGATFESHVASAMGEIRSNTKVWAYAIEKGYFKIAKLLIEQIQGTKVVKGKIAESALKVCSFFGVSEGISSTEIANLLMKDGPFPKSSMIGWSPIMFAINAWNFELVKLYIDNNVNVEGEALINYLYACHSRYEKNINRYSIEQKNNAIKILDLLLEKGAVIESSSSDSPNLIYTKINGDIERSKSVSKNKEFLLKELLKREGLKKILVKEALFCNAIECNHDLIKVLVESGVDINKASEVKIWGKYHEILPIWSVMQFGDIEMIQYFIDNGADWKKINSMSGNILHYVASNKIKLDNLKFILEKVLEDKEGVISSFFSKTEEYGTPLDSAIKSYKTDKAGAEKFAYFLSWILKNNDKINLDLNDKYLDTKQTLIAKLLSLKIDSVTKILSQDEKYAEYAKQFEQKTLSEKERLEKKALEEKERLEKKALEEKKQKTEEGVKQKMIEKFHSLLNEGFNENNKKAFSILLEKLGIETTFDLAIKGEKWGHLDCLLKLALGDKINHDGTTLFSYLLKTDNAELIKDFANIYGVDVVDIRLLAYADLAIKAKKWGHLECLLKVALGDKINHDGTTLFSYVLKTHDKKLINDFANNYGLDTVDEHGFSLLAYSVLLGDVESVKNLLYKNPKLSLKFNGKTLNEIAAQNKDINENFQKIFELFNPNVDNKSSEKTPEPSTFNGTFKISQNKPKNKEAKKIQLQIFENIYNAAKNHGDIHDLFVSNGIITPKQINGYYKYADGLKELEQNNNNNNDDVTYSWVVDGKTYKSKGMVFHDGYYMTIDCNVAIDNKFYTALAKGLASQSLDDSGIKLVNTIMEIKIINGGDRVYAKKYYINDEGKKLVIFNEIDNHNALDRITIVPGTFKGEEVPSTFTEIPEKVVKVSNKSEFGDVFETLDKIGKTFEKMCASKVVDFILPDGPVNLSTIELHFLDGKIIGQSSVRYNTSSSSTVDSKTYDKDIGDNDNSLENNTNKPNENELIVNLDSPTEVGNNFFQNPTINCSTVRSVSEDVSFEDGNVINKTPLIPTANDNESSNISEVDIIAGNISYYSPESSDDALEIPVSGNGTFGVDSQQF